MWPRTIDMLALELRDEAEVKMLEETGYLFIYLFVPFNKVDNIICT